MPQPSAPNARTVVISPAPSGDCETMRAGRTFRIELACGVRARLTSLAAIRRRCRVPGATGGAGTTQPAAVDAQRQQSVAGVIGLDVAVKADSRLARGGERQRGIALQHVQRSGADDVAVLHQDQVIGEPLDLRHVVADVDHRKREPRRAAARGTAGSRSWSVRSSADSGSSISSSFGCDSRARPIATRCRSPPERLCGERSSSRVRPSSSIDLVEGDARPTPARCGAP